MAMNSVSLFAALVTIFIGWYFSSLPRNYQLARKTGLPILVCPVNPANPLWLVLSPIFQPFLARYLPSILYDSIKVAIYGWEFRCRYTVNAKLGPAFVLVNPGENEIWIADPEMACAVLMRRNDFKQSKRAIKVLSMFGLNISSSNGDDWQRHRKMVAPLLNERIMSAVWLDSSAQTREMLHAFTRRRDSNYTSNYEKRGTNGVVEGVRTIAINVIGSIGYGDRRSWTQTTSDQGTPPAGFELSFMEAVLSIVNYHVVAVFVSTNILTLSFMPKVLRTLGAATVEFPKYAKSFIFDERKSSSTRNTLIGALVKIADDPKGQTLRPSKSSSYLSEDEITGNLFNFTIAGFDTTASTMAYALMALAIQPQWQDWIAEEIDRVARHIPPQNYENTFPLLTRCLALMYEILRLYTPVMHISRHNSTTQLIPTLIPANTSINVAFGLIHVSPTLYGPDPLSFRPTRWLAPSQSQQDQESLIEPPKGTFLPWSGGPRYCPGIKMAQVEFVGVMREIFATWRVEVVERPHETSEMARKRLESIVENSQPKITLQVKKPSDVVLRWVKR